MISPKHRITYLRIRSKILLQAMRNKSLARRLVATYDNEKYYNAHNLANITAKPDSQYYLRYILGCFNSTLLNYWYKAHFPNVNINPNDFRCIPIRLIDIADPISPWCKSLNSRPSGIGFWFGDRIWMRREPGRFGVSLRSGADSGR
jgi:hypothetical protein